MTSQHGLTRRDFLKRGAVLGGTLAWVTPAVQVVGLRPAFAATVSPVCGDFFAVKIDPDEATEDFCVDIWDQTDPSGEGQCLDVDAQVTPIPGGCGYVTSTTFENDMRWVIGLGSDCEFQIGEAELKTGILGCVASGTFDPVSKTVTFDTGPQGQDISNVQFVFCKVA